MTKIDIDSMKGVILGNNTLSGLKSDMNGLGFDLPEGRKGEKKAYKEALMYWRYKREYEFPLSEIQLKRPEMLSFTEVKKDDCDFKIYGFYHGTKKKPMGSEFKTLIKNEINNIKNPSERTYEGNACFCESGFNYIFEEFLCQETDDISLKSAILTSFYPLKTLINIFTEKEIIVPYANFEAKNFQNPSFYKALREVHKRKYLPEPINMEYFNNDMFYNTVVAKRSEHMADFVNDFHIAWHNSIQLDPKEIGLFCGLGHEPQIEYFLKSGSGENEIYPCDLTFYRYEK